VSAGDEDARTVRVAVRYVRPHSTRSPHDCLKRGFEPAASARHASCGASRSFAEKGSWRFPNCSCCGKTRRAHSPRPTSRLDSGTL